VLDCFEIGGIGGRAGAGAGAGGAGREKKKKKKKKKKGMKTTFPQRMKEWDDFFEVWPRGGLTFFFLQLES